MAKAGSTFWGKPCWEYWDSPPSEDMYPTRDEAARACASCYARGVVIDLGTWEYRANECIAKGNATAQIRGGFIPIVPLVPVQVKVCPSGFFRDIRWCPEGCSVCSVGKVNKPERTLT